MLYYNTVNDLLRNSLYALMASREFSPFRLVGGTSLSLQLGHRISIDIDLFSDAPYGSIDFRTIDHFMENHFPFVSYNKDEIPGIGKSYFAGTDKENTIKIDVFYADPFIQKPLVIDGIRFATIEEIIAMKMDVIQRGGRKKDFWDLHELLPEYGIKEMLVLHRQRYEYGHNERIILQNFVDFTLADEDFTPICLRGKHWEFIKEDIEDAISAYLKKR